MLARGVHIAATLLACGTIAFAVIIAEPAGAKVRASFAALRHQLTVLTWFALALTILSGAAWLVLLASDILGASITDVCLHGGAWPVLFDTRFGLVWCVRLVLALLLGVLICQPATRGLQLAAAAALIALPALVGHAGASPGMAGNFHLVSDMVHLLAAGAWLGGLPAFALLLARARSEPGWVDVAVTATRRFSVVGILSVGGLLASGLTNSWYLLSGPRDLVTTDYGRLVALKIGLFAAMVTLAAVNRFYLTPRLPERSALRALLRNSIAEIGLGLCVVLFVAILGTLPPAAHIHPTPADIPPNAAFVHIHAPEAMADVTVDPGRAGTAQVTIRVVREDFSRFPAKDVRLVLEPPSPGGRKLERDAIEQSDGSWGVNGIPLAESGIWTVRVIVTPSKGEPIPLDAPIVIER
ncbi:MAG: copper homeostasis membrane protein CopD [Pseudolabrys sp.]